MGSTIEVPLFLMPMYFLIGIAATFTFAWAVNIELDKGPEGRKTNLWVYFHLVMVLVTFFGLALPTMEPTLQFFFPIHIHS